MKQSYINAIGDTGIYLVSFSRLLPFYWRCSVDTRCIDYLWLTRLDAHCADLPGQNLFGSTSIPWEKIYGIEISAPPFPYKEKINFLRIKL